MTTSDVFLLLIIVGLCFFAYAQHKQIQALKRLLRLSNRPNVFTNIAVAVLFTALAVKLYQIYKNNSNDEPLT